MFSPILTAFSYTDPTTRDIAEEIAAILREERLETDIHDLTDVSSLEPFRAVVIGAPFDAGEWLAGARQFLAQNREALVRLPVAVFALSPVSALGDANGRHELLEELARFRWLHPIAAEVFPATSVIPRANGTAALAAIAEPAFDREAVRAWARLVARLLTPVRSR